MLFGAPHPLSKDSWASSDAARRTMQGNRRRDTAPELAVRRLLHAAGCRYRVDAQPLPGLRRRADIVFARHKLAVFIDGCYWHGCSMHGTTPRTNSDYWSAKLAANRARDIDTVERLAEQGWQVARYWEHEDPVAVAADVLRRLGRHLTSS